MPLSKICEWKGIEIIEAEAEVDVLFCSANQVGLGSIQAAQSKGIMAVDYSK